MIPDLEVVSGSPADKVADDELLIILRTPEADESSVVKDIKSKSYACLQKSHHNSVYQTGFLASNGAKPFVIVEWSSNGNSPLERRWVAGRLARFVGNQFSLKKIVFYLDDRAGAEQLAIIEDFVTSHADPLYGSTKLDFVKILCSHRSAVDADCWRKERALYGWEYRKWMNENPDELTSLEIGARLGQFCKKNHCGFKTLNVEDLEKLGMNLLLAVGQASELSPSCLHIATHRYEAGCRPLMLVGKGITFDTGGINVKPHEGHVNCMKNDMGGAGLMANLFMALVASGFDQPLVLLIPSCENLVDAKSMKPGSIIQSYSGKKVIIEHTDAEGRLILADALSYGDEKYNPAVTLVAATLTTAVLRQFTNFFTAVHFANDRFITELSNSSKSWAESFTYWDEFLPFLQGNRTKAADLTNMGRMPGAASIGGGSNVAGHFLKQFISSPMIHFDIFASAWNWSGDYPGAHYGATGAPFNSLFQTVRNMDTNMWGYRS